MTAAEAVGIFSDTTGNLVGPEVIFGPGKAGNQLGNTFFESVPNFVLAPGDYSLIFLGAGVSSQGGGHLTGGGYLNLGDDINLPGGGRFNGGTDLIISLNEGSSVTSQSIPFSLVDPVPDGGMTSMLLGASLVGLSWLRRKV
jgi:hypothetical protein